MNKYLPLLLSLLISISTTAQVEEFHKGTTIFVTGGIAIPGSELAEATGIEVRDYVERGVFSSLGLKRDIHRNFAVGLTGGYSQNKLNVKAIEAASSTSIATVPWTSSFLVADFYGQLPLRNWTPYFKGSVGAMFPNNWEFYAEQEHSNGTTIEGTTRTTETIELAYLTGIGLNYTVNKFVIGVESNILAYKPEFEIDLNGSPGARKQWIATLNQTLSIGYKF